MTGSWPPAEVTWYDDPHSYGMPVFAQRWLGGEYPAGRGLPAEPEPGWCCPGCRRGYSPKVTQCYYCPESSAPAVTGSLDLTWTPDALEPDES